MKNKFLFIFLLATLSGIKSFGQDNNMSKIRFAILGGVNYQNLTGKDFTGRDLNTDGIIGFHGGVNAQIRIADEFYFQPGLLFTTKGAKINEAVSTTYNLSYVELPLNLVYKSKLGTGYMMLGFGPYVAYGVAGKTSYTDGNLKVDSDIEFTNVIELTDPLTKNYVKPLDLGANIFFGYELAGGIFIQLNTQFGMINSSPEDKRFPGGETSIKNTGFGLSLGYRF